MSHQENGRKISRSDMLGNVQAQKDGKGDKRLVEGGWQPLRENRDQHPKKRLQSSNAEGRKTTPPGKPGPAPGRKNAMQQWKGRTATPPAEPGSAPRKKATEKAVDAIQNLCKATEDEMIEQRRKVIKVFEGLRPRPTTHARMKVAMAHKHQHQSNKRSCTWEMVKQHVMNLKLPEGWAGSFESDGNRKHQRVHRNVQFPIEKPETKRCGVHKKAQFSSMKMKFAPPWGGFTKTSRGGSKQAMKCKQNTRKESKQKTHQHVKEKATPAKDLTHQHQRQQPKPADQHLASWDQRSSCQQNVSIRDQHPG
eukprot:jgi/Bigna1/141640/aug1.64_g16348